MVALPVASQPTVEAIYKAYEDAQDTGYREHLGASIIGTECERALWYSFRWQTRARHAGRLLRLFDTGNLAEARFVNDLRRIGVTVLDLDPKTGKQWSFRDETGHFGGSGDAIGQGFIEAALAWHIIEMKTHGSKSFAKLIKEGVAKSKPLHLAQMQIYMHLAGLGRAIYIAVNKDTDELYSERVHYDKELAIRLLAKAKRIIESPYPPSKISNDPAWFVCRFCDHNESCHGDAAPERHCRSCLHSSPIADGKWWCARHEQELTRAEQEQGCPLHRYLPPLVPGEQSNVEGEAIIYLMRSGDTWRDEGPYHEN